MKDELIAILPDLKQAVEQGIAYAGDLFNRAVSYYTLISIISIVIGALLLIGAIIGIFKAIKWCKNKDNDWLYNESALIWLLLVVPLLFGIIILSVNINNLLQLTYIPEIYILQLLT